MRNLIVLAYLVGCATHAAPVTPTVDGRELESYHVGAIHAAATEFAQWGRVDERPNLAVTLCRLPMPEDYGSPSQLRMSPETGSGGPSVHASQIASVAGRRRCRGTSRSRCPLRPRRDAG